MSLAFFAKRAKVWELLQDENIGNGATVRHGLIKFSTEPLHNVHPTALKRASIFPGNPV